MYERCILSSTPYCSTTSNKERGVLLRSAICCGQEGGGGHQAETIMAGAESTEYSWWCLCWHLLMKSESKSKCGWDTLNSVEKTCATVTLFCVFFFFGVVPIIGLEIIGIKIDAHVRWVAPQRMATQTGPTVSFVFPFFLLFWLTTDAATALYRDPWYTLSSV
jgi:hypothetical protein